MCVQNLSYTTDTKSSVTLDHSGQNIYIPKQSRVSSNYGLLLKQKSNILWCNPIQHKRWTKYDHTFLPKTITPSQKKSLNTHSHYLLLLALLPLTSPAAPRYYALPKFYKRYFQEETTNGALRSSRRASCPDSEQFGSTSKGPTSSSLIRDAFCNISSTSFPETRHLHL